MYARMGELESGGDGTGAGTTASSSKSDGSRAGSKGGGIPGVGTYLSNLSSRSSSGSGDAAVIVTGEGAEQAARGGRRRKVRRTWAHHEAALVAASKLGMWEEAMRIYRVVEGSSVAGEALEGGGEGGTVTDNMILSVVGACVRASNAKYAAANNAPSSVRDAPPGDADMRDVPDDYRGGDLANYYPTTARMMPPPNPRPTIRALTVEERRRPLDEARQIVLTMEERHDIPIVARHVNPLASAYNRLGLRVEASTLINGLLKDRAPPPPPPPIRPTMRSERWREKRESSASDSNPGFEAVQLADWTDDDLDGDDADGDYHGDGKNAYANDEYGDVYEETQLNVHELKAKDRASYSLLVQGAAMEGDWTGAIEELRRMTDAGLHPNTRNLNSWNEVMERRWRPSGNSIK